MSEGAEKGTNKTGSGRESGVCEPATRGDDAGGLSWHIDHSALAAIVWSVDGRVLKWNARAESLFGWSAEEVCGRSWADWRFVHEEDAADVERDIARLYSGELQNNVIENRNHTRDGEVRWCRWHNSALRDEQGRVVSILSQVDDVSAYKFEEFRYRGVFENMPEGLAVYRWNPELGGFVFSDFNPRAESITRVTREWVLGRPLLECFPAMEEFGLVEALGRVMRTGQPEYLPPRFYRDETREGWRENRVYRLPSGEVAAIFADVTERMQAQEQLRAARDRAEDASLAKSEFLANMSHEIRTPLNGVLGMLQLLRGTRLDEEQASLVNEALGSSLRLTRLLSDILDISRIEAGRMPIRRERFHLGDIFESLRELLGSSARCKGVELECTLGPGLEGELVGDQTRLQQVLFNLAGNAVKFTEAGTVRVRAHALGEASGGVRRVLFMIEDTGIGIRPEILPGLLEPFTQAESAFTRSYDGAGLGLTIVRRLLGLMGGNASLDSEPGRGTTVYVSLPFGLSPA